MATNIEWILKEEGDGAKIALWAHNSHIAVQPGRMGDFLRKAFGDRMVVFGMTFNQGGFHALRNEYSFQDLDVRPARAGTLERTLAAAHAPVALIPFRKLPAAGLDTIHFNSDVPAEIACYSEENEARWHLPNVRAARAYDAMFFVDRTSAAHPLPGGRRATMTKLAAPGNLGFETGNRAKHLPSGLRVRQCSGERPTSPNSDFASR